jgi:hypothetical protein
MAKKKKQTSSGFKEIDKVVEKSVGKSTKQDKIFTPTGDDFYGAHRLLPRLRYGKVSAEYFCKDPERRAELGLPPVYVEPEYT